MKLLITGASGFIGGHVLDIALANNFEIAVIANPSSRKKSTFPDNVKVYEADIQDKDEIIKLVNDFRPEIINHHAAKLKERDPITDASINLMGSLHILEAARQSGTERVIFASSGGAIYGDVAEPHKADISFPLYPNSPYATSKIAIERYLETYKNLYGLEFNILRYANVYGPRQNPNSEALVVGIFFERLAIGLPVSIFARENQGDSGCHRDYIYVDDVAKINLLAIMGLVKENIINVSSGIGVSTLELANLIANTLEITPKIDFQMARSGDVKRSVVDATLMLKYLGELTPLSDGIRRTANWLVHNNGSM